MKLSFGLLVSLALGSPVFAQAVPLPCLGSGEECPFVNPGFWTFKISNGPCVDGPNTVRSPYTSFTFASDCSLVFSTWSCEPCISFPGGGGSYMARREFRTVFCARRDTIIRDRTHAIDDIAIVNQPGNPWVRFTPDEAELIRFAMISVARSTPSIFDATVDLNGTPEEVLVSAMQHYIWELENDDVFDILSGNHFIGTPAGDPLTAFESAVVLQVLALHEEAQAAVAAGDFPLPVFHLYQWNPSAGAPFKQDHILPCIAPDAALTLEFQFACPFPGIRVTVTNQGLLELPPVPVRIYQGDPVSGTLVLEYFTPAALQPGEETVNVIDVSPFTGGVFSGDFTVVVDEAEGVLECYKNNNIASTSVYLCLGDLDMNGVIDADDLGILLGQFGFGDGGDIDCDGITDADDLGLLLGTFGSFCPDKDGDGTGIADGDDQKELLNDQPSWIVTPRQR